MHQQLKHCTDTDRLSTTQQYSRDGPDHPAAGDTAKVSEFKQMKVLVLCGSLIRWLTDKKVTDMTTMRHTGLHLLLRSTPATQS